MITTSLFLLFLFSCGESQKDKVTIASAASLQYVIKELTADFSQRTDIDCEVIIGSSGKLTAQIVQGAPYNILLSADMKYPEFIDNRNLALQPPEVYAYGKMVFWTVDESVDPGPGSLALPSVGKIAIANPKTAPYGEAAMEFLTQQNLLDAVRHKLVFGESIAQTNQFISTRAASLGITSLSSVLSEPLREIGKWSLIGDDQHSPIAHGVVVLDRDKEQNELALRFYSYLFSNEATVILEEFGYSRNE